MAHAMRSSGLIERTSSFIACKTSLDQAPALHPCDTNTPAAFHVDSEAAGIRSEAVSTKMRVEGNSSNPYPYRLPQVVQDDVSL